MGIVHPIALLTELAGRQIAQAPPQIERTRDTITKLRQHARDASNSTTAVLAWITGEESQVVNLREGIEALVALIGTDSEVRGVRISHAPDIDANTHVSRRALRTVVAASLIATVDMRPSASTICVNASTDSRVATIRIDAQYSEQAASTEYASGDRLLSWDDTIVLAELERIEVRRIDDPYAIFCRFPVFTV